MKDARCLVLGAAVSYGPAELRPFIQSLRQTGYGGEVVMLASPNEVSSAAYNALLQMTMTIEPYESWRYMPLSVHMARYVKYYEFLLGHECDFVMLSDTRDVIFQANPFELSAMKPLYFFLEDDNWTIGKCDCNGTWVEQAFGPEKRLEMAAQPVSCSGITIGSRQGILVYLTAMLKLASMALPQGLKQIGIDQGIHNVLIYENLIPGVELVPNQQHINTMGRVKKDHVRWDAAQGKIVNRDGSISPIVHQYDYAPHDDILKEIRRKYAPSTKA